MNLSQKILSNTIVQVAGKISSTALNLFAFALMTRELGQNGFGEYTTVITFLSFFLASLVTPAIALRSFSES